MKKEIHSLVAILFFLWPFSSSAQEPLVFTGIEKSSYATISKRVMVEAYKRLDINVKFSDLPAARSLAVANSGRVDGELYRIKNIHLKYKNLIMLPVPIGIMEGVGITINPNISLQEWKSLVPYRVCIRNGVKFAESGTKGMKIDVSNTNEHLFYNLGLNRCDVIILARLTSIKLAQDFEKEMKMPVYYHVIQTYPLFHYLHKKNKHLVPKLVDVLEEMQVDGTIASIRESYIEEISSTKHGS
ncbi:hypothetical protein WH96_20395 [Kiloniella spongiae]|uniref:Solute-binding protein family 3/N-terminal domain-containing protein n=1 Tax=Kiloniella spongiae TaxID=1489064 RepID=A0A0H2MQH8_9PROT|nr:transporter substrate-binding domain-containing protein [Kiloniella spongiae]KLN58915.1 hypothetical protein WH96_20395 [Kiloniella spongiae]